MTSWFSDQSQHGEAVSFLCLSEISDSKGSLLSEQSDELRLPGTSTSLIRTSPSPDCGHSSKLSFEHFIRAVSSPRDLFGSYGATAQTIPSCRSRANPEVHAPPVRADERMTSRRVWWIEFCLRFHAALRGLGRSDRLTRKRVRKMQMSCRLAPEHGLG